MALDKLVEWAEKWAMSYNLKKCKILHVGTSNPGYRYVMAGQELQVVEEEKDIGILVHKSLKPAKNCQKAAAMAGVVLRQVTKNFHYRDRTIFRRLYCQYVRPHLEFATPAWAPWQVSDIEMLEKVQKRAVGMIKGLKSKTYEEKCRELDLDTLAIRREKADLIQVYKILNKIDKVEEKDLFRRAADTGTNDRVTRQRSNPLNLQGERARIDLRKYSFTSRVVKPWNDLKEEIKGIKRLDQFKNSLKQLYRRRVEGNYAEQ